MPISQEMPYRWYNTPNLHLSTPADFEDLLATLGLLVTRRSFMAQGRAIHFMPGSRSTQAIYRFRSR
jgi:hypothetical protein